MVDIEAVEWAYRLFLCREPDRSYVDGHQQTNADHAALRDSFVSSPEFQTYLKTKQYTKPFIASCLTLNKEPFYVTPSFVPRVGEYVAGNPFEQIAGLVRQSLGPGDAVVDVGAAVGWFSLLARRFVASGGKVYAFEPHSDTFEALTRTIAAQNASDVILCSRMALGSRNSFTFVEAPLEPDGLGSRCVDVGIERVPVGLLDNFNFRQPVRMIKISTNGSEDDVISGAVRTIRHNRPLLAIPHRCLDSIGRLVPEARYEIMSDVPQIADYVWLKSTRVP